MKTSDSIAKIAPALLAAQSAITFAAKDAVNPHFKSKFADLPAVIDAVKEALNKNGIAFLQAPSPSTDGNLHLTTRLLHASGEWIEDEAVCPLPANNPQGYGSALTYLRRYSLSSFVGLYADDDDGNAASVAIPAETGASNAQIDKIMFLSETPEKKARIDKALSVYGVPTISKLTHTQAATIINKLAA